MFNIVVEPLPHDVLNRESALVCEIILAQQVHHFFDVESILDRHELAALILDGIVYAHGDVHAGRFAQHFEGIFHANGRHGDALGAPCQSPRLSENLYHLKHIIKVVERLAHTHEYDVGELLALWHAKHLVDDLVSSEVAVETLAASHTEVAVHATPLLRRDAQSRAIVLGDENALNSFVATGIKEVFNSTIFAGLCTLRTI